jgi:cytochrome c
MPKARREWSSCRSSKGNAIFSRVRVCRAAIAFAAAIVLGACGRGEPVDARYTQVSGGDIARGQRLLGQYQCGSCHVIPDVAAAAGSAGPSLAGFGQRSYIAGEVPSAPATLMRWIESPHQVVPGTLMPDMGVSATDARDMAAYLLSLR